MINYILHATKGNRWWILLGEQYESIRKKIWTKNIWQLVILLPK